VWGKFPASRVGHWAWELRLVRRVTSDPIKGKLMFYDVDETLLRPV
jgi:hypothetical protein